MRKPERIAWTILAAAIAVCLAAKLLATTQAPVTMDKDTLALVYPTAAVLRDVAGLTPITTTGTAATAGTVVLVAGTGTVSSALIQGGSLGSLPMISRLSSTGTLGHISVGTVGSQMFTITSLQSNNTVETGDGSTILWFLIAE